ncbi:endothelial differentiation-related factor 1 homolog [Cimex lectularius]|uniref:HTH cro/C1-type domain-containing protein n=1 Tax=Cimex lectularius TaxID=79782 RepID=A0A8I6RHB9_CIMLE|nr:endothelial differentiation-related factor 1 homolog [Cimex lectularius]
MSDWETVTTDRRRQKAPAIKKTQVVNNARREGVPITTQQKWGGGQNKQHFPVKNTAKLDQETEELKHKTIPLSLGKLIQKERMAKGWSQKEFATKCNEKPQVVNDYEAGRGIPNQAIIGKMERVLGIKLRGKKGSTGQSINPQVPPGKK